MAKLGKAKLMAAVFRGFEAAGCTVTPISSPGTHPIRFVIEKGAVHQTVRVYIWNLTHGGGAARPKHEYRIQITSGIRAFDPEPDGVTLILGWNEQFGVFAAFDASRRKSALGASPSIQISEATLNRARVIGAAVQDKGNGEFAVAVRPDRLLGYVESQSQAHAGDVTAILTPYGESGPSEDPNDTVLEDAIRGRRDFRFGSAEELAQRSNVLERLEALEREVASLRPALAGRGHNRPPELLPTETETLAGQIEEAAGFARDELQKPEPNVAKVARSAKFFRWISRTVAAGKAEAGKLGQKLKEKGRDRTAEFIVAGGLLGGTALWEKIFHLINLVTGEMLKWLHLL